MSIRRRLVLVVFLSAAVVSAAVAAILQLVGTGESARIEAAQNATDAIADAVASAVSSRTPGPDDALAPLSRDYQRFLEKAVGSALAGAPRAFTGVCGQGTVVPLRVRGRHDGARVVPLPPDALSAIGAACAANAPKVTRSKLRPETLVVSVAPANGGQLAFAAMPVFDRDSTPLPLKIELGLLAALAIALVVVTLDGIVALRRGAKQLDVALERLGEDLGASIEVPRAEELARIAAGLRRMAGRLAEAQARERSLARDLEHEQRLAALGRVAAGVAHEVRNPLAGMKLRLDLMVRDPDLSAEQRSDLEACLGEVARLDRVVRSLLGVARREPEGDRVDVPLASLVDERLALVSEAARTAEVRVAREGDGRARSDRDALGRVIDNLVRNAIEASPTGGEVDVEIAQAGEGVEIAVLDDGPGVPDARAGELFEPFFTTKAEGTGLGLFLSRSLVRALGGTLSYARVPGERGTRTRFSFTLPTS